MAEKFVPEPSPLSDPFDGPSPFDSFLERNQKGLVVVAAILILGAGGWLAQRAIKASNADSAATELAAAKSPEALQEVAKKRANTPAGPSASILLADA
ncbi:MAG: hypothetical protein JWO82_358, partial [Akkermansiaceae bacterium]|nr:hypothetical protein [Akkermansiaceae bacterium]